MRPSFTIVLTEAAKELIGRLPTEPSVLPMQGPPGLGKTFTGARMIVGVVRQGKQVGIAATSHKVIRGYETQGTYLNFGHFRSAHTGAKHEFSYLYLSNVVACSC